MAIRLAAVMLVILAHVMMSFRNETAWWDSLPYTWLALEQTGETNTQSLHSDTYSYIRAHVNDTEYDKLIGLTEYDDENYRHLTASDPDYFRQQLGFYRIKPALPFLMGLGHRIGLDPVISGQLVSLSAYVTTALLIWIMAIGMTNVRYGTIISILLISMPFITYHARMVYPDMLSTGVIMTALWLYLRTPFKWAALLVLMLSIWVRPDNFIMGICVITALSLGGRIDWRTAGLSLLAISASFLGLVSQADYLGWSTHFYVSFYERDIDLETFTSPVTLGEYVRNYPSHLSAELNNRILPFFLIAGVWLVSRQLNDCRMKSYSIRALFWLFICALCLKLLRYLGMALDLPYEPTILIYMWFAFFVVIGAIAFINVTSLLFFQRTRLNIEVGSRWLIVSGLLVFMFVHFIMFPIDKDRMMMAPYIFISLLVFATIRPNFEAWIEQFPKLKS